jgi:hypothetical protein
VNTSGAQQLGRCVGLDAGPNVVTGGKEQGHQVLALVPCCGGHEDHAAPSFACAEARRLADAFATDPHSLDVAGGGDIARWVGTDQEHSLAIYEHLGQQTLRLNLTVRQRFHAVSAITGYVIGSATDLGQSSKAA